MLLSKKYLAFFLIILATCVMFLTVQPLGHDLWFHTYRIGAMAKELQLHPFRVPIRILSDTYNGYGYGVPLYYGDLLLYLPAILTAIGLDAALSYRFLVLSIFLLILLLSYYAYYSLRKDKDAAFTFSIIYSYSSYSLLTLCVRSAIGESSALIFFPLIFISFYKIVELKHPKSFLPLALGMSGVILSHIFSSLFITVFLFVLLILSYKKINRAVICSLGKSVLLTLSLCASFIFPLLEQMLYQKTNTPGNTPYQMKEFIKYALDPADFFMPYDLKKILAVIFSIPLDVEYWHPGAVGLLLLVAAFIFIRHHRVVADRRGTSLFAFSVLLTGLMFAVPLLVILRKYISFIQFPWRLLFLSTTTLALFLTRSLVKIGDSRLTRRVLLISLLIGIYTIGFRYAYQVYVHYRGDAYLESVNPGISSKYHLTYDRNAADMMYLPEEASADTYKSLGDLSYSAHEDIQMEIRREKDTILLIGKNTMYDDLAVQVPFYMYKGYIARDTLNGKKIPVTKGSLGLVEVNVPRSSGEQIIEIKYAGTLVQHITNVVSLMALLFTFFILFRKPAFRCVH